MGGGGSYNSSGLGDVPRPMQPLPRQTSDVGPFAGRDQFGRYPARPQIQDAYSRMVTGRTPLKGQPGADFFTSPQPGWQDYYPASKFPLKKPGVPWDPNTDWYGNPTPSMEASTQFPPVQAFYGQGTKML